MSWYTRTTDGWVIAVHAQPGAKRSEIAGLHGTRLKVRIAARAVDGRANAALEAFLADALGVAKSSVRVTKGHAAREKLVAVTAPGAAVEALLRPL